MSAGQFNGAKLKQARLGAGMTQAALARAVSTSERNIVRWETGKSSPRVSTVAALAAATGHPVEFFLGDDEDEEAASTGLVDDLVLALERYVDAKLAGRA